MYDQTVPVITLDGPSGTGKGTICQLLAQKLGWNMLDSGAIYRVLAYAACKNCIEINHISELTQLAMQLNLRFEADSNNTTQVLLDGESVEKLIRSEQCGQDASKIAAIPEIRQALLERQRGFAKLPGLVTDGRDMGTVVFPNASLKIFLYANEEERAKRRYLQLQEKQINVSLAQVVEELAARDARDSSRTHAPLKPATDAVQIDTSGLSVMQVFDKIVKIAIERLND